MTKRPAIAVCVALGLLGALVASPSRAQITTISDPDGRRFFINAEPLVQIKLAVAKPRATIYLPSESSFSGRSRPAVSIDRDGVEKLVRDAADRHRMDAALIRAVIQTESNWNPAAYSRKGAAGLMQLIPTTAIRFGVIDIFNPQQNVDGGVRYLKTLLQRYNGNLDLALAAYNAGEGAVDRAHGIPAFRETRNYVQKVQSVYLSPGSGHLGEAWLNRRAIRKDVDVSGRIVFTND